MRLSKRKWPCGQCTMQCIDKCIYCKDCHSSYHAKCEQLTPSELMVLEKVPHGYLCLSCSNDNCGKFDFTKSLRRIERAGNLGMLESAVRLEKILMRKTPAIQVRGEKQQTLGNRRCNGYEDFKTDSRW